MEPIIIVSGWMRSGTTMMMKCLHAGGIEVIRDPADPDWEIKRPDFELHRSPEVYAGKAVKSLKIGPARMRPWAGGYKLIYMERNAIEQQESWFARSGRRVALDVIIDQATLSLELAENRKDTEVLSLRYEDVVSNPREAMQQVADFIGRPFDVAAAARVVDPEMKHWTIWELPGVSRIDAADYQSEQVMREAAHVTRG